MYLEYGTSFGKKKRFKLEAANGCVISADKNDDIYVASLAKRSKVSVFQEADEWVMMGMGCSLIVAGKECQSIDLHDGLGVVIGKQEFKIVEIPVEAKQSQGEDKVKVKSVKNAEQAKSFKLFYSKYSKVILAISFSFLMLWLFFGQNKKNSTLPEPASEVTTVEGNVSADGEVSAKEKLSADALNETENLNNNSDESIASENANVPPEVIEPEVSAQSEPSNGNEDSAYSYYIDALSYYDLGFLKQAIQGVQVGLLKHPGNSLLLSKLNEWEGKLNILISQSYKDACLHALYLRNLEAQQSFAMVVEMSIDTKDVRYRESVRMYKGLESAAVDQRLECGVL